MTEEQKERKRARWKAWYEANKERLRAQKKAWYEANKEQLCARARAWHEANKERSRAQKKAWYEANKERRRAYREVNKERRRACWKAWYEANKERMRAYQKAWRKANPEACSNKAAIRRARLLGQTVDRNCPIAKAIYAIARAYRKAGIDAHVDHVIPLSRNGPHHWSNLNVVPAEYNLKKGAKMPHEVEL